MFNIDDCSTQINRRYSSEFLDDEQRTCANDIVRSQKYQQRVSFLKKEDNKDKLMNKYNTKN